MERQLKERLIGAAVLVALAVVMVPEMFSGPGSRLQPGMDTAAAATGQLKTYNIELQPTRQTVVQEQSQVEAPAERPRDEVPATSESSESTASAVVTNNASSTASSAITSSASLNAELPAKPVTVPSAAPVVRPAAGNWAVQVGSFGTRDKAQQIVAKLKEQGYPAFVGSVTVGNKTLYRVRVGAMAERAAADSTLQKLKTAYPGASVVAANR